MNRLALFTDISLDPKSGRGIGAYVAIDTSYLTISAQEVERSEISERLCLRRFENTSSTRLEVQTVLWALEEQLGKKSTDPAELFLYTDSQCVAGLLRRRGRLEAGGFKSGKTRLLIKNAALYQRFYELHDELRFEVIKVAGHCPSCTHDTVHRIFSFVDKEVRRALLSWSSERGSEIHKI